MEPLNANEKSSSPESEAERPKASLDPYLAELIDILSDFFEGFGFKPNIGRLWSALFYSVEPLSQRDLVQMLDLSAGMVSQGLHELMSFGMVVQVGVSARRESLYQTERNLTRIVFNILARRELIVIDRLISRVENLKQRIAVSPSKAEHVTKRIEGLDQVLTIAALAKSIIGLVETFSHYSYHAVSVGTRALSRIKVPQLPKLLEAALK